MRFRLLIAGLITAALVLTAIGPALDLGRLLTARRRRERPLTA